MISPQENKENVITNYNVYQKNNLQVKSDFIEDDLGCVSLSDTEDERDENIPSNGHAVTEEFLDQAEKCLMDIEKFESAEEAKMELINLLYQHIQLQRQGSKDIAPITYKMLKQNLLCPTAMAVEQDMLDSSYINPYDEYIIEREENSVVVEEILLEEDEEYEEDFPEPPPEVELPPCNIEDIAIKPKKTFQEILDEELKKEEFGRMMQEEETKDKEKQLMPPPPNPKPATKRKFLKRGEGIARFNNAPSRKPIKQKSSTKHDPHNPTIAAPKRTVGFIRSAGSSKIPTRPNKLPFKIKVDDHVGVVPGKDPAESYKIFSEKTVMSPVRNSPEPSSPPTCKSPTPSMMNRMKSAGQHVTEISGFLNPDQVEEHAAAAAEELEEFRMLEQAAADKSINSLIGMLKFAPNPSNVGAPQFDTIQEETTEQMPVAITEKLAAQKEDDDDDDDFDDNETWGFNTPVKTLSTKVVTNDDTLVDEELDEDGFNGASQPSKLLGSLFPGLKPHPPPMVLQPAPNKKEADQEAEALKANLKSKLAELEKEVARFQQEAAGLARARTEKESELRKLREENDKYVADLDEREKKFQEYKDRELKVIRAEKKEFEMTQLSAKQRAAKLELVDSLTERVASLEEELVRKEERWNATYIRLKDKAEAKEKECEGLHKQITVLEQDKLAMWEKEVIRSSNKRHKAAQTETAYPPLQPSTHHQHVTMVPEVVSTVAMPTVSENTIKPALAQRHPTLARLDQERCSVKFAEPEYVSLYPAGVINSQNGGHVTTGGHDRSGHDRGKDHQVVENTSHKSVELLPKQYISAELPHKPRKPEGENAILQEGGIPKDASLFNHHQSRPSSAKGGTETINSDGSVNVAYSNGTVKHTSSDGKVVTMTYFNGDTKQTFHDGRVVYKFLKDGITQTQMPSGMERTVFPTGQEESKHPDGRIEIKYPDKSTKITYSNGEEKSSYVDGTVVTLDTSGQRLIVLPNGQREVHTSAFKRREYPDGTSKTVYSDGRQETKHSNGRVRKKDAKGTLVSDLMLDAAGNVLHDFIAKTR